MKKKVLRNPIAKSLEHHKQQIIKSKKVYNRKLKHKKVVPTEVDKYNECL